ncbi:AMIN domain-containing protein [Thiohalorhabdus sp.]|uniref:AMIN domain-containing protein n=1 Tax=Thiohalorhabdus sp. TaxID=3094134 RepID=UPI002FC382F8
MARNTRAHRKWGWPPWWRAAAAASAVLATGAAQAADVPVRCADHDTHFRVVLDLPEQRPLAAHRAGGSVVLEWPGGWQPVALDGCRSDRRLKGLRRQQDRLVLELDGGEKARAFTLSEPPRWVVDLGRVESNLSRRAPLPEPVHPPAPLPSMVPAEVPEILARARSKAEAENDQAALDLLEQEGESRDQPAAVQFELGRLYADTGQTLKAAQQLWQAASEYPDHAAAPAAFRRAANLFDRLDFHFQATNPLESYLRNYPLEPQAREVQLELGRLYALAGEVGSAREELIPLTYAGADELAQYAHYWLAYLLARGEDFQGARTELDRLLKQDPTYLEAHADLLLAAAETFLETEAPQRARNRLSAFLSDNPTHPRQLRAILLQGRAFMALEQWRRAAAGFQEVLDAQPQADIQARARAGLVRAEHALDRIGLDEAVARLEAVASGLPGSQAAMEARLLAARMLADADRRGKALGQLRAVLKQGSQADRRNARPLADRLLPPQMAAALEAGEPLRAFRLYNRFAGETPSGTVRDRGFRALLRLGALKGARRFLGDAREEQGSTVQIDRWQWLLARAYRKAAAEEGVAWIDQVLERQPGHPRTQGLRLERARLLSRLDRHADLLDFLDRHSKLPRDQTVPLRARAHKAQGDLGEAFSVLDTFAREAPEGALSGSVLAEAGDLGARLGRVYRARAYWLRALKAGVPDWERRQLKALLGVDAVQREDFKGARAHLEGLSADDGFGRAGNLYASLIPLVRERLP